MTYNLYIWKRRVEDVFIFPFVLMGKLIAIFKPLQQPYDIFFFFPFYHTGGAEKVHALLAQQLGGKKAIVFFTRRSADLTFFDAFKQSGCAIKDISAYTDNKWLYFLNLIYRGVMAGYINTQSVGPIVFNGQCNFAYKLSPWIKKEIQQIELIHSFNSFSWIRLPFLPFITSTVMISKVRIQDHINQYQKLGVPDRFQSNIHFIVNGIPLPEHVDEKDFLAPLKILYVGRSTPEKRVHLVAEIAALVKKEIPVIEFIFAGDMEHAIPSNLHAYCSFKGMITDADELAMLYQQAHIIIITSSTEGFPMVVEEAMAYHCAVLATPVGDLPVHIQPKTNGYLTSSIDAEIVLQEMAQFIFALNNSRDVLTKMGENNRQYALAHFSITSFKNQYLQLLLKA